MMSENISFSDYLLKKEHFEIIQQILKEIGGSTSF